MKQSCAVAIFFLAVIATGLEKQCDSIGANGVNGDEVSMLQIRKQAASERNLRILQNSIPQKVAGYTTFKLAFDGDCFGNNSQVIKSTTVSACASACDSNDECAGFSFGMSMRCVLKDKSCTKEQAEDDGWEFYKKTVTKVSQTEIDGKNWDRTASGEVWDVRSLEEVRFPSSVGKKEIHKQTVLATGIALFISALAITANILWPSKEEVGDKGRLPVQIICLLVNLTWAADYTLFIPSAYDLARAYKTGASHSGMLIGAPFVFMGLGCILAKALTLPWDHWFAKKTMLFIMLTVASLDLVTASLITYVFPLKESSLWLACALRSITGFAMGGSVVVHFMGLRATTRSEMSLMNMALSACTCLGVCLGPLVSSLVLDILDIRHSAVSEAAAPLYAMAMIWAVQAVIFALFVPDRLRDLQAEMQEDADAPRDAPPESCEGSSREHVARIREWIFLHGLGFTVERAFTVSAVEAATAFIFQAEYGFGPIAIGYYIGVVFIVVAATITLLTYLKFVGCLSDQFYMAVLPWVAVLGSMLLFRIPGTGSMTIIVGDCLIYTSAATCNGLMDSFAIQSATPGTVYSLENYQVTKLLLLYAVRGTGPICARFIIQKFGRGIYAGVQTGLALSTVVLAWQTTSHLVQVGIWKSKNTGYQSPDSLEEVRQG